MKDLVRFERELGVVVEASSMIGFVFRLEIENYFGEIELESAIEMEIVESIVSFCEMF